MMRRTGRRIPAGRGWLGSLAVLPGLAVSALPVGLCPACWPAYAGLLGALGLGALLETRWMLAATAVALTAALAGLAWHARSRRGWKPFLLGLLAASVLMVGKFALALPAVTWTGAGLLLLASLWNAWPLPQRTEHGMPPCPACVAAGAGADSPDVPDLDRPLPSQPRKRSDR